MDGVIYARRCPSESAVRAFTEVSRGSPDRDLRDLSQLEIGNVYYSIERYDEAAAWFTLPPDSPRYADSLLRLAWTQYRLDQPVSALDHVLRDAWQPEAEYLRALVATKGGYAAAVARVDAFEATYAPVEAQLRAILTRYASDKEAADEAFRLYGDPRTSSLPSPLLAQVHRDRELQGFVAHLALMDREERIIRRQVRPWREAVGGQLLAVLVEDRTRLQRRAGLVLLERLARDEESLSDLLTDARVLRFEIVDALELDAQTAGRRTPGTSIALLRALIPQLQEDARREATLRLAARVDDVEAIPLLESLLDPPWPRADEAVYQLALADSSRRIALLTRLVTAWPDSGHAPDAWLVIGDDHLAHGRFVDARDAYLRVASLTAHPNYAYANYRLAWALHALGDHAGGQEKFGVAMGAAKDDTLRAHAASEREKLGNLR
jgi:tetratricopeptide (TPR) repeat protein